MGHGVWVVGVNHYIVGKASESSNIGKQSHYGSETVSDIQKRLPTGDSMDEGMIMLQSGDSVVTLPKNNSNIDILKSILDGMKGSQTLVRKKELDSK